MAQPLRKIQQEIRDFYPELGQRLEERRRDIVDRVSVERAHMDEQVISTPGDAADESVIDSSAEYFSRIANHHVRELGEISSALERMTRGVYGVCETCESEISVERLRRLPYARLCVDCQAAAEKLNRPRGLS